jgi:hypothetical protein
MTSLVWSSLTFMAEDIQDITSLREESDPRTTTALSVCININFEAIFLSTFVLKFLVSSFRCWLSSIRVVFGRSDRPLLDPSHSYLWPDFFFVSGNIYPFSRVRVCHQNWEPYPVFVLSWIFRDFIARETVLLLSTLCCRYCIRVAFFAPSS